MTELLSQSYDDFGIRFRFPENWDVQEQPSPGGVMISVNSPGTSFWSVLLEYDGPEPRDVLQAALNVFREEYAELDSYPVETTLCRRESLGQDVEFVCLDLLNTACLRTFRTRQFTVLVLYQGCDEEFEETRAVLEAMTGSLECDGDEPLPE